MSILLRRGTDAERLTITPQDGEIIYTTDTQLVYIGDGVTVGGNPIAAAPGESNTASNLGAGQGVFFQKTGVDLEFKSLIGGTDIALNTTNDDITINYNGSAEANTASNLGAGEGVFFQKTGVDLEFKSFTAGTGINISSTADEIDIANSGVLSFNTRTGVVNPATGDYSASNITNDSGVTGAQVDAALDNLDTNKANQVGGAVTGNLASLTAGGDLADSGFAPGDFLQDITGESIGDLSDVDLTGLNNNDILQYDGANWVPIVLPAAGEVNTASNLGATVGREGVFAQKTGVDLEFKSLVPGTGVTFSATGTEITINSTGAVTSWNTRTGAVVPVVGDYSASEVTNDSGVTGVNVDNALDQLDAVKLEDITGESINDLSDVNTVGALNNQVLQYDGANWVPANLGAAGEANTASNLPGDEGVFFQKSGADLEFKSLTAGTGISLASTNDAITITASGTAGVTSWNTRTGAVVPESGDYDSDLVDNASAVGGVTVSDALDLLNSNKADQTINIISDDVQLISITNPTLANDVTLNFPNVNAANGIVKIDASGFVPVSLLPATQLSFEGSFDASPGALPADLTNFGQFYTIAVAGTLNLKPNRVDPAVATPVVVGDDIVYNGVAGEWIYKPSGSITIAIAVVYDNSTSGLAAVDVQAAIDELDSDKLSDISGEQLDDLSDVITTLPASGQLLTYNGTNWVNQAPGGVTSFNTRTGAVVPASGDYDSDQVNNASGVTGASVSAALDQLDGDKTNIVSPVVAGNFAGLNAGGDLTDSGFSSTSFATAAQGLLADSAIQPADNISLLTNDSGYITDITGENLGDLSDVILTTPAVNQVLTFNGLNWINQANPGQTALQPGDNVSDLINDANYTSAGDNISVFVNDSGYLTDITGEDLGDLSDVVLTAPAANQGLTFNGTNWINTAIVNSFNGRSGAVTPQASDYDADQVDFDNTSSGFNAVDVQAAFDELFLLPTTVPIGAGQTFTTINAAIEYYSRLQTVYQSNQVTLTLELQAGFVMAEQVLVVGQNLGWMVITGVDAQTTITGTAITDQLFDVVDRPVFGGADGARLPTIRQLFDFDLTGVVNNLTGITLIDSSGSIRVGAGFNGSNFRAANLERNASLTANGAVFTNSGNAGVRVNFASHFYGQNATITDNATDGIIIAKGSSGTLNGATISDNGNRGALVNDAALADLENTTISNNATGIETQDAAIVTAASANFSNNNLTANIRRGSRLEVRSATINQSNASQVLYAREASIIDANGVNVTAAHSTTKFQADTMSSINLNNVNLSGSTGGNDITVNSGSTVVSSGTAFSGNVVLNTLTPNGIIYQ